MKRLIHKYLDRYYHVEKDSVYTNEKVYRSSNWLCLELTMIFNLSRKQLKWYIKSWCKKKRKSFNFIKYWKYKFDFVLPPIGILHTSLVGCDPVAIEPMAVPSGQLFYLDYGYNEMQNDAVGVTYSYHRTRFLGDEFSVVEPYVTIDLSDIRA